MQHNPGFLNLVNDAKSRVQEIDIDGYKKMVAAGTPHLLVDTREDNEWDKGHVAGVEAFIKAARAGGPQPIPLDVLAAVSLATFGAMESLVGGSPVDLTQVG